MDVYRRCCCADRVRWHWFGAWFMAAVFGATAGDHLHALSAAEPLRSRFFYNDDGDRTVTDLAR